MPFGPTSCSRSRVRGTVTTTWIAPPICMSGSRASLTSPSSIRQRPPGRRRVHVRLACDLVPPVDDKRQPRLRRLGVDPQLSADLFSQSLAADHPNGVSDLFGMLNGEPHLLPPHFGLQRVRAVGVGPGDGHRAAYPGVTRLLGEARAFQMAGRSGSPGHPAGRVAIRRRGGRDPAFGVGRVLDQAAGGGMTDLAGFGGSTSFRSTLGPCNSRLSPQWYAKASHGVPPPIRARAPSANGRAAARFVRWVLT